MSDKPTRPQPSNGREAQICTDSGKAYYKASRPWYKKKRFILPLAFVLLVVIVSALGGGGSDSGTDTASDTSGDASTPKPPAAKKVKAAAMLKEFDENEAAADAKYAGKLLRVTGVVDGVDTDMFNDDDYIIQLAGGGDYVILTVNCNGIPPSVAANVKKGQKATVVGKFDDGGDLGVELKDCALV